MVTVGLNRLGDFLGEFATVIDEIEKLRQHFRECTETSPIKPTEESKKRTEQEIDNMEEEILADMIAKNIFSGSIIFKFVEAEAPSPWFPIVKFGLSKTASALIDPFIKSEMDYIRKLAGAIYIPDDTF
jgi:hypothetical protein